MFSEWVAFWAKAAGTYLGVSLGPEALEQSWSGPGAKWRERTREADQARIADGFTCCLLYRLRAL